MRVKGEKGGGGGGAGAFFPIERYAVFLLNISIISPATLYQTYFGVVVHFVEVCGIVDNL